MSINPQNNTVVYACPVQHDGISIFVKGWLAENADQAQSVILIHDLCEQGEDYKDIAVKLSQQGINAYIFTLRIYKKKHQGVGPFNFDQLATDLLQVVAWVKHKHHGKKPIIIGQGLGALVALYFTKNYSRFSAALVLSTPWLVLQSHISPFYRLAVRTLARLFPNASSAHWVLSPMLGSRFDRKFKQKVPLFMAHEILIAISRSHKIFSRLSTPTLALCSQKDKSASYTIMKRLVSKHKSHDLIQIKLCPTQSYCLIQESHFDQNIFNILTTWVRKHEHGTAQ